MGLTIHFTITPPADWTWPQVVAKLDAARQHAKTLPFASVPDALTQLQGKAAFFDHRFGGDRGDPETFDLRLSATRHDHNPWKPGQHNPVWSERLAAFSIDVADGCEFMDVGVAKFAEHRFPSERPGDYAPYWKSVLSNKNRKSEDVRASEKLIRAWMKRWGLRVAKRPSSGMYGGSPEWASQPAEPWVYAVDGREFACAGMVRPPYVSHRRGRDGKPRAFVKFTDRARQDEIWFERAAGADVFSTADFQRETTELMEGREHVVPASRTWVSFVKTQYASDPNCGGIKNFLKAHLSVVALLDHLKTLGFAVTVHDEGHYWEKRDIESMVREIGEWNGMMAAFGGALRDRFGPDLESAIHAFPNFEHLEAEGAAKHPEVVEEARKITGG